MKKWALLIFILCSCTTNKITKTVARNSLQISSIFLTNQQQTDSILRQGEEIREIKRGYVFLDTMFFKKMPDGTITLRDSLVFNIGVFKKLYVGVPNILQDTLLSVEDSYKKD